jgi:hypothetical protein
VKITEFFASDEQIAQLNRYHTIERWCVTIRSIVLGMLFSSALSMMMGYGRPPYYLVTLLAVGATSDTVRLRAQRKRLALMKYIETHQRKADWDD